MSDVNTNTAPLRVNSSARIAIGLGVLLFFAGCVVGLALYGTHDNGLHQTLMTGSLWIMGTLTLWFTSGVTGGIAIPKLG